MVQRLPSSWRARCASDTRSVVRPGSESSAVSLACGSQQGSCRGVEHEEVQGRPGILQGVAEEARPGDLTSTRGRDAASNTEELAGPLVRTTCCAIQREAEAQRSRHRRKRLQSAPAQLWHRACRCVWRELSILMQLKAEQANDHSQAVPWSRMHAEAIHETLRMYPDSEGTDVCKTLARLRRDVRRNGTLRRQSQGGGALG